MIIIRISVVLYFLYFALVNNVAHPAACCGGGSQFPALITGDFRGQLGVSQSYGKIIGDKRVSDDVYFWPKEKDYTTYTTSLNGSYLFDNFFQVGFSTGLQSNDHQDAGNIESKSTGIQDSSVNIGYEFLPEGMYSEWKPRGIVYLKETFPFGKSTYESASLLLSDVTGRGQASSSLGVLFFKQWTQWDLQLSGEFSHYYRREVENVSLGNFWSGQVLGSLGFSPGEGRLRFGFSLAPSYFESKKVKYFSLETRTDYELFWNAGLSASYLVGDLYSVTANYLDQTLWGPVNNTTLSRTVSLLLQRRFSL